MRCDDRLKGFKMYKFDKARDGFSGISTRDGKNEGEPLAIRSAFRFARELSYNPMSGCTWEETESGRALRSLREEK